MPYEFKHVDLKAPRKAFKKEKWGEVRHITRISFDVPSIDDETLLALANSSDGTGDVTVTLKIGP